ncbi:MAG: hypothetical protein WC610_01000 [Patescibacteria group bacterium]
MEKVVKCRGCGQYFMHTEKAIKCPFCHTEYGEVEEKVEEKKGTAKTQVEEKAKDKKGVAKTRKGFFKIRKDN